MGPVTQSASHSQTPHPTHKDENISSSLVASLLNCLSYVACCVFPFMALLIEGSLGVSSWTSRFPSHGKYKQRKLSLISETTLDRIS